MTKVNPIPEGRRRATPYLVVNDAARMIAFYKKAFGATEELRKAPGGKIGHAEIVIVDSPIMLADEHPEVGALSPQTIGGSPVSIMLYVEDVDRVVERALAAGAKLLRPVQDQFYGDRSGTIADPAGHVWNVASRKEDLSLEEIKRRGEALAKKS